MQTLVACRLIAPGSEGRWPRNWFEQSALADRPGGDFGLAEIPQFHECLDRLPVHQTALFDPPVRRWKDLCNAKFAGLLDVLTSPVR